MVPIAKRALRGSPSVEIRPRERAGPRGGALARLVLRRWRALGLLGPLLRARGRGAHRVHCAREHPARAAGAAVRY